MRQILLLVICAVLLVGCGSDKGRVKGRVLENGQPIEIDGQMAVMIYLIDANGKPNPAKSYPIPLNKDGTFELAASGGEVPPGTYMVSIEVNAPPAETGLGRFKGRFPYPDSKLRQEIKAGMNDLQIDLAKPPA